MKFNKIFLMGIALEILAAPATATAGGSDYGYVKNVSMGNGGYFYFTVDSNRILPAPCATSYNGRWAFNASTPAGQVLMASILTAYSSHIKIAVTGGGYCNTWPDSEDVAFIQYENN